MSFGSFVAGAVVGGGLVFGSLSYHVLRTSDGVALVPKATPSFYETYVDVREFGVPEWTQHKTLVAAIVKAKKEEILKGAAGNIVTEGFDGLFDKLAPTSTGG